MWNSKTQVHVHVFGNELNTSKTLFFSIKFFRSSDDVDEEVVSMLLWNKHQNT